MDIEYKEFSGAIIEVKQDDRPEGSYGIVEGYGATWDLDRGDWSGVKDQFIRGAFRDSIADYLKRSRDIRLLSHHTQIVGKFPIDSIREDDRGLFGRGEINLKVQEGREIYALVQQHAISDFSIGFSVDDFSLEGDVRSIHKATIWEISAVTEPMNPYANITDIKTVVPYQNLPLAERDVAWDADVAKAHIQEFTGSEDEPSSAYRKAFVWYDKEHVDTFGAYKLPIVDVIGGKLVVIPRAIFAAAAAVQGARGGIDLPPADRPGVIRHLERYYAKMDMPSPFEEEDERQYLIEDVKGMTPRDLERVLRDGGAFSRNAAKYLASRMVEKPSHAMTELYEAIKNIRM